MIPPAAERHRAGRGRRAWRRGVAAEDRAVAALTDEGWRVLGRRLRTPAGEVDLVAEKEGLLAIVEVKSRPTLDEAAWALSLRQRRRLVAAAAILLAQHPQWGGAGVRFDVMLVDAAGAVRRLADAFRAEDEG